MEKKKTDTSILNIPKKNHDKLSILKELDNLANREFSKKINDEKKLEEEWSGLKETKKESKTDVLRKQKINVQNAKSVYDFIQSLNEDLENNFSKIKKCDNSINQIDKQIKKIEDEEKRKQEERIKAEKEAEEKRIKEEAERIREKEEKAKARNLEKQKRAERLRIQKEQEELEKQRIEKETKRKNMIKKICSIAFVFVIVVCVIVGIILNKKKYSLTNLTVNVSEIKKDSYYEYNNSYTSIVYFEVINDFSVKISFVKGEMFIYSKDNNAVLWSGDVTLNGEINAKGGIASFYCNMTHSSSKLYNSDLDDVIIKFKVNEINFENGKFKEYKDDLKVI